MLRPLRRTVPFVTLGALMLASVAVAATARVPKKMIGTWARGGHCAAYASRLAIGPYTAALGRDRPAKIVYDANDDGAGHGAIHWAQEGNVDNFVYDAHRDRIVHNIQGYHMPGAVEYRRCRR